METKKMKEQPKPETIKFGLVWVKIWTNRGKNGGVRFNTEFIRRYKDDDGKWQSTTGFRLEDLPLVSKLADRAEKWIHDQKESNGREDDESPTDD